MLSPSLTPTSVIHKIHESKEKSKQEPASGNQPLVTVKRTLRSPVNRTSCHPGLCPPLIETLLPPQIPNCQPYSGLHLPPHYPRPIVTPKNRIIDLKQLGEKHPPWHPQFQEHLFSTLPTKSPLSPMSPLFSLLSSFTQGWSKGCWPREYIHSIFQVCSKLVCFLLGWT